MKQHQQPQQYDRPVRFEIGLTTPQEIRDIQGLAGAISRGQDASGVKVIAYSSYAQAIGTKSPNRHVWKLAPSAETPGSFSLLSGWIKSDQGLMGCSKFLKHLEGDCRDQVLVSKSVGLRVHVKAKGISCEALARICQNFVTYETSIDTLLPESRRTGSKASQKFFQSNLEAIGFGRTLKEKLLVLGSCVSTGSLIGFVNPSGSCYKLNLRNVANTKVPFLEFRQHCVTSDTQKMQFWAALCSALVESATQQVLDLRFNTLFSVLANSPTLRELYQKRRNSVMNPITKPTNASASDEDKPKKKKPRRRRSKPFEEALVCSCPKCGASELVPKKGKTFACPSKNCQFHSCRKCGEEAHCGSRCVVGMYICIDAEPSTTCATTAATTCTPCTASSSGAKQVIDVDVITASTSVCDESDSNKSLDLEEAQKSLDLEEAQKSLDLVASTSLDLEDEWNRVNAVFC